MPPPNCPSCNAPLPPAEIAAGWCESCGKKIPAFVVPSARTARSAVDASDQREDRPEPAPEAALAQRLRQALDRAEAPPVSDRPRHLKQALIMGGIFAANVVVAYALAGTAIWTTVLAIAGVLLAFMVFFFLKETIFGGFRSMTREGLVYGGALFLYAVALLASGYFISEEFARGTVHVDNFSAQDVVLELDGIVWTKSAKQSTRSETLTKGSYTLIVRSPAGAELDRQSIVVDGRGNYVLNVLGAQVYTRGTAEYGGFSFGPPRRETRIQSPWFKADVDYLFEEPPPSITVSVKRGQTSGSASRTYLRRGEPKQVAD